LVAASPSYGKTRLDVRNREKLDYEQMFYRGKRELERPKKNIFFYNNPAYHKKKRVVFKRRNQPAAQRQRKICGLEPGMNERKQMIRLQKLQSL